jgi:hypothetical protein
VTSSSAGTPKLAVGGKSAPAPAAPAPAAAPFIAPEPEDEEDPFGAVAVAEEGTNGNSREHLQALLGSARQVIASLESALDRARAHEREIAEKISQL